MQSNAENQIIKLSSRKRGSMSGFINKLWMSRVNR